MTSHLKSSIAFRERFLSRFFPVFILCVILTNHCFFSKTAHAGTPSVSISPTSGTVHDTFTISVTISGTTNSANPPEFEFNSNFAITLQGQSSQSNYRNGAFSSTLAFNYSLTPKRNLRPGKYKLPKATVVVDGKKVSLERPVFELKSLTTAQAQSAKQNNAEVNLVQKFNKENPYIGEQIVYQTVIVASDNLVRANLSDIDFKGFWKESFGKQKETVRPIQNSRAKVYTISESLFATESGKIELPGRTLVASIRTTSNRRASNRWSPFDDFFATDPFNRSSGRTVKKQFFADPISINVKPLPSPPSKDQSHFPVGKIQQHSKVDKSLIKEGESINFELIVSGNANLRPFELSEPVYGDIDKFKIYNDEPTLVTSIRNSEIYFQKSFKIALVPHKSGKLELPRFRFYYFDPEQDKYIDSITVQKTINVIPPAKAANLVVTGGQSAINSETQNNSNTIQVTGDGLAPQFTEQSVLNSNYTQPSKWIIYCTLFLFPSLCGSFIFYLKNTGKNVAKRHRATAKKRAIAALDKIILEESSSIDQQANIFRSFLGDILQINVKEITKATAVELTKNLLEEETTIKLKSLLSKLEKTRFGSSYSSEDQNIERAVQYKQEIVELITIIDQKNLTN